MTIPDPIFAKLDLVDAEPDLAIKIKKCWATPTSDEDNPISYVFIDNYQVAYGEGDDVKLIENCAGSSGAFSVNSFGFGEGNAEVYLHCQLDICDGRVNDCNCTNHARKRRNAEDENQIQMSVGPVGLKTT